MNGQLNMGVFEGLVVLDLSRRYPGAYTTMFLGDFGAEVIKVDPPITLPFPNVDTTSEHFAVYYALDRNKKSLVINLKNPEGLKVFYKLVKKADVLVEGFRPGVMDRLNAGYNALKQMNDRLIYCSLSGYGWEGPYFGLPGHDVNYIAISGAQSLVGERNGRPYMPSNLVGDMGGAGLHGVIGILIALIARERTGRGQFVDIAYLDSVLSLLTAEASFYFATGRVPKRGETVATGSAPWVNIYKCKDEEYITLGCVEPHFWENLCRLLGQEDFIPYHNNPAREKYDDIIEVLSKIFLTRTRDEWFEFLKDKNVPVGPVYYLNETFSDPQVKRRMLVELEHPRLGKVKQVGIAIKLSETPGQVRSLGVVPGTNTNEILDSLGYSEEEKRHLWSVGAVGLNPDSKKL